MEALEEQAKSVPPVAFPLSMQYKKNMDVDIEDGEAEEEDKEPKKKRCVLHTPLAPLLGPSAYTDSSQPSSVAQPTTTTPAADPGATPPDSVPAKVAPKPKKKERKDDVFSARKEFVEAYMSKPHKKKDRKKLRAEAEQAWSSSLERAKLLSSYSLSQLKRRRFVPTAATSNPFAERVKGLTS